MICPYCFYEKTAITNSRKGEDEVIRERKCKRCGSKFYTSEKYIPFHEGKKLIYQYEKERKMKR